MYRLWLMVLTVLGVLYLAIESRAQLRPIVYTDNTVEAGIDEVWTDWTTAEGLENFFGPKAIIDGKLGGAYEVWFLPDAPKGQRGAEDGILLGWQKESADGSRMIQFTWKMPPYMPEINEHMTVVQLWMIPMDNDTTRLRLFHTGFGDTPKWMEARDYFNKSWPSVMELYKTHIDESKK